MRFYKIINNCYLVAIGNGSGGEEITEAEYNNLLGIIHNKPIAPDGYGYRLKDTLEWELYELPIIPPIDDDLTAEEALAIISGGVADEAQ